MGYRNPSFRLSTHVWLTTSWRASFNPPNHLVGHQSYLSKWRMASYVFMTRRGAWACLKRSLATRRPNVQRRHKAHTQMLVRLYDEERCMGTPEMLPRHKTTERTKKAQGTHTNALTSLWRGEVHGHARNAPSSQEREQNTTQIIGWRKQHALNSL